MVTITIEFQNVPAVGTYTFRQSFKSAEDALIYLQGYINFDPITILSFTVEKS
jgi:hypothetical protein